MKFVYFICPETPQFAKYCEAFFNYLTYGYKNWTRDRYVSSSPTDKDGRSRLLKNKRAPKIQEMRAGDYVLDRIYEKVITNDCYLHHYKQIEDEEIENSKCIVFITSNKNPIKVPKYLSTDHNTIVTWKMSNIKIASKNKYHLLETLVRKMTTPKK